MLTPSSSDYSSTSSSFCWAAQPGSWKPKPSVWRWLLLRHLVPNCDGNSNCDCNSNRTLPVSNSNSNSNRFKPSVAPGYIIVWHPPASCGRRNCTEFNHVHRSRWYLDIFYRVHLLFTQVHLLIDSSVEDQYVTSFSKSGLH